MSEASSSCSGLPSAPVSFGVFCGVSGFDAAYRVTRVNWPSWSYVVPMCLVGTAGAFWVFQGFEIILEG